MQMMLEDLGDMPPEKPERPKPKDAWDKADILIKLLTGGLIVGFGFLLNSAANRVTQATQKAQLAASMVDSLVKQDPGVKRDIVLVTLNSIVGREQPELVCALSLQIVRGDFRTPPTGSPSLSQGGQYDASLEATKIINQRCPDQVSTLANVSAQRAQLSSANAEKTPEHAKAYDSASSPFQTYVLPNIGRKVAYIQYRADWPDTEKLNSLHNELEKAGFVSPRRDEKIDVSINFKANVRYFHAEDRDAATSVQGVVRRVLGTEYKLVDLSQSKFHPPVGQLEIWCSPDH
jgi:hypothetical protein